MTMKAVPVPNYDLFSYLLLTRTPQSFADSTKSCVLDGSISVGPRRPQIDKSSRDGVKRSITKLSDIYTRPVV